MKKIEKRNFEIYDLLEIHKYLGVDFDDTVFVFSHKPIQRYESDLGFEWVFNKYDSYLDARKIGKLCDFNKELFGEDPYSDLFELV